MPEVKLEETPRKVRELFDKGFAAMERGNLDYAMDMFTAGLDLEPRLLQARQFLRAAALKKFKQKKSGSFTHTLASIKGMGSTLCIQSTIKKNPQEALRKVEKLLRTDPLNTWFIKLLDQAAIAAELPEVAIQTLELASEHYPHDVSILQRLGERYMEVHETRKGRACYEKIAQLNPNDPKAIKAFKDAAALDTMHKGGWKDAASFHDVIKDTKEAELLEQQAKAVKTAKDIDALIVEAKTKIEREPENVNYKRALADLYARDERFEEALVVLEEAQRVTGGGDPHIDRAMSAIQIKRFDWEIERLRQVGDQAGLNARKTEKDAYLLKTAATRVEQYPNDLLFKYDYGVLLFEHAKLTEAIHQFQQSQRNPQRRTQSLYYLGRCFKQKNQLDIAAEQLEKAAAEIPSLNDAKKDIFYELGEIQFAMGNREKAIAYLKEIYAVDIGYKDVAEKIEQGYKP